MDDTFGSLPRRIFLASARRPRLDEQGFVLPLPADEVVSASDLLHHAATLIVAPPWTGKTFVSEQLHQVLKIRPDLPPAFGEFCARLCFETLGRGAAVRPSWWDDWLTGDRHACWIIDAIDEDERSGDRRADEVLGLLEALKEARARLHVLFFCRESEVPPDFLRRAEGLFGVWSPSRPRGLRRLRLTGLDRESARACVGADAFERVCRILEANGLQDLASLPVVLEHLKGKQAAERLERLEIWRGLLKDLLRERPGRARFPISRTEVEDRFEVVQWLAAVLTFSGQHEFRVDEPGSGPDLETLIPIEFPGRDLRILREAARSSLRTAVFERARIGFRFAQDHVREWFTALALREMPLGRARPLLTLESGQPNPAHEGIMDLLAKIAGDPALQRWIEEVHGGVVPPSGAVPWTLAEAIRALDSLQELARTSPWGLALWHGDRLSRIAAPGLGAEIARRLEESLSTPEQELLLDVALAVGAIEALTFAIGIVRDSACAPQLRAIAAYLIAALGGIEDLSSLALWVRSAGRDTLGEDSSIPILVIAFFKKGIWDFEATADFALSRSAPGSDWLQNVLSEELSLDLSRRLIAATLARGEDALRSRLVRRAAELMLKEETLDENDGGLLLPVVLAQEGPGSGYGDLGRMIEQNLGARRSLFLAGLALDPEHTLEESWRWKTVLKQEDAVWLLDLIRSQGGEPGWLLGRLYSLTHQKGTDRNVRRRVRREIGARDSKLLARLDQEEAEWRRELKGHLRRRPERKAKNYEIELLVRSTLDNAAFDLHWKMLRLSWCCFVKPSDRPTNVIGQWDDLREDLQGEVMVLCRKALIESKPTPIPEGTSYPSSILWEEACFEKLLFEDPKFVLTSELIRKWLPAVLRCWETDLNLVLQRCADVDRELSEDLIVAAVLRDLRSGASYTAQELMPGMWSERLAARLEEEAVVVQDFSRQARIDLLGRIARVYPGRAAAVARRWTEESSKDPELRDAGIDILLAFDPVEGWSHLTSLLRQEGAMSVLLRMRSLRPNHRGPATGFDSWPASVLESLAACLIKALPPGDDPVRVPGEAYSVDREKELRWLRDSIPAHLFRRNREGDAEALERLANAYPSVRLWLDQTRAQQGAEGVLAGLSGGWPISPGTIPVDRVVRLLQDKNYRLLRTADDLQAVVLEELEAIAVDVKRHLAMLYRPPEAKQRRRRLPEDALQAYLHCRLTDRLTKGTLEPHPRILLNREPLAARNTRNDIKIEATAFHGEPLTLIIEVKWSDNADVSTSLVEQLGKGYLKENGLTHGIYFVGWCGHPKPEAGLESWRARLEEQARLFQQDQPGLKINPFLVDLTWELHSGA